MSKPFGPMQHADCATYWVRIYIAGDYSEALASCRRRCSAAGACFTVTRTEFIYSGGQESGVVVGLINYPRYPKRAEELFELAVEMAEKLLIDLGQYSVSIECPDKTTWFSRYK